MRTFCIEFINGRGYEVEARSEEEAKEIAWQMFVDEENEQGRIEEERKLDREYWAGVARGDI